MLLLIGESCFAFFPFFSVSFFFVSPSFFWDRTTQDLTPLWASDLFSTPRIVRTWKRWKAFRKWRACLNFTWSIVLSTWFIGNTAFRECNTGHDSLEPCAITSVTCMTVRVIKSVEGSIGKFSSIDWMEKHFWMPTFNSVETIIKILQRYSYVFAIFRCCEWKILRIFRILKFIV